MCKCRVEAVTGVNFGVIPPVAEARPDMVDVLPDIGTRGGIPRGGKCLGVDLPLRNTIGDSMLCLGVNGWMVEISSLL